MLIHDEVKIQDGLVFEVNSMNLVGFEMDDSELQNLNDIFSDTSVEAPKAKARYVTSTTQFIHSFPLRLDFMQDWQYVHFSTTIHFALDLPLFGSGSINNDHHLK